MKKWVLITIILILLTGIGLLGYYLGINQSDKTDNSTNIITDDSQESREFSVSGEKINAPLFSDNFESIKIGSIPKEKSSILGQPFVEDYDIASKQEDIQFFIATTNSFPEYGDVIIKAYNKDTSSLMEEVITLNLRRGENTLCCYPVPKPANYEAFFYYEDSLIKVLDLSVK